MKTARHRPTSRMFPVATRRYPVPSWRGACLLVLAAAALGPLAQIASAEEDSVQRPDGVVGFGGMPPLVPDDPRDKEAVRRTCDALITTGRLHRGTRVGGDFLFSAAGALYDTLRDFETAMPVYEEAVAAYPPGDPTRPIVQVHLARREVWRGNHPRAASLLADVEPWETARTPPDLTEGEQWRWAQLHAVLDYELPLVRADLHEAAGQYRNAARSVEGLANANDSGASDAQRARLWERSARLRYRGGDRAGALAAVDRAIELQPRASQGAERRFWRVHAKHGLLAEDGAPYLPRNWPGDAYERDVRTLLGEIQHVEGVGTMYLALGSTAYTAGKTELALEIYLLATRAPGLVEQARGNPMIWRGLLAAFPAALHLGRLEDAERILDMVEHIADEPIEEIDDYRAALIEARAEAAEKKKRAQQPPPTPEAGAEVGTGPTREPLGRLEAETTPASESREPGFEDAPSETAGAPAWIRPAWIWIGGAACLLLCLGALVRSRRR